MEVIDIEYSTQISVVFFDCTDRYIDNWIEEQGYDNLEIIKFYENDSFSDLYSCLNCSDSAYVCFVLPDRKYSEQWLKFMLLNLLENPESGISLSIRYLVRDDGEIIACYDPDVLEMVIDKKNGREIIKTCILNNKNVYGDLSSLLVERDIVVHALADGSIDEYDRVIQKTAFLYYIFLNGNVQYCESSAVDCFIQPYKKDEDVRAAYISLIKKIGIYNEAVGKRIFYSGLILPRGNTVYSKEITFVVTCKAEYYNVEPIAIEAEKRGYKVIFTDNMKQKAEIGVYCYHEYYPENSRFSIALLHDISQGNENWPNFWQFESWEQFDLAFLPGPFWERLYSENRFHCYACPKHGMYTLGFPKSDVVSSDELKNRVSYLRNSLKLKYDYTVLYAPSWEYKGKEDDMLNSISCLPVNIIIKHVSWPDEGFYGQIKHNIEKMRFKHEGKYENLYYLDTDESIMSALGLCDLVISDESSVMGEALMFGKPSIAVSDWLVPTPEGERYSCITMDYVYVSTRKELRSYVKKFIDHEIDYSFFLRSRDLLFGIEGDVSKKIMDAIDYFTNNGDEDYFLNKIGEPKYEYHSLWN